MNSPEFRLYYNPDDGVVLFSTGSGYPAEGTYMLIPKDLYVKVMDWRHHRVVDGKLIEILPNTEYHKQLKKSNTGWKVVKNHAGIIIEDGEDYPNYEYYNKRNN